MVFAEGFTSVLEGLDALGYRAVVLGCEVDVWVEGFEYLASAVCSCFFGDAVRLDDVFFCWLLHCSLIFLRIS